jgi:RimJ/RimL family protein N-acetyltransferase
MPLLTGTDGQQARPEQDVEQDVERGLDAGPERGPVRSPARAGRHVAIRPVVPGDHQWLYELATMTDRGAHWRLQGTVPPFDEFVALLYRQCRATFALERLVDHAAFGLCQLFDFDSFSRTAQLTAMIAKDFERKAWPMEGIFLFLDYAFECYSLRKIYLESFEEEAQQYRSAVGKLLTLEGRLTEHRLVYGRYVDLYIFSLRREDFAAVRDRFLPVVEPLDLRPAQPPNPPEEPPWP